MLQHILCQGAEPFDNDALYLATLLGRGHHITLILNAFVRRYQCGEAQFGSEALHWATRIHNLYVFGLLSEHADVTGLIVERDRRLTRDSSITATVCALGEVIYLESEPTRGSYILHLLLPHVNNMDAIIFREPGKALTAL